jgi:hypothetical protein
MRNQFFIFSLFLLLFLLTFSTFHFSRALSANNDDGFFSVGPEDYYNLEDYGEEESEVSNQLHDERNKTSNQNTLQTSSSSSHQQQLQQ